MSQISQDIYSGKIFLIDGKRTPFGKFGGSLGGVTPVDLSVAAGKAALESSGVKPDQIDHLINVMDIIRLITRSTYNNIRSENKNIFQIIFVEVWDTIKFLFLNLKVIIKIKI